MIAAMVGGHAFVGRAAELAALSASAEEARAGRGSIWLVCGEAGIGKSRLMEEVARRASSDHVVAWGRCWEEGGAPPFWPWTQILRSLLRKRQLPVAPFSTPSRAPWLTGLVPELADHVRADAPPSLDPELSRFRLLDAVTSALCDVAEQSPLLLLLEDLHVADASSLELLEFLARQIRASRIALLGTLREAEARRADGYPLLARLGREARQLVLPRLDRDGVAAVLGDAFGREPPARLVDAMYATTEGNPLFLTEIARRYATLSSPDHARALAVIPPSVQIAISERVGDLSPATRELLETASALGREVPAALLGELAGTRRSEVARALAEAVDRAVLVEVAPDLFRFSHILVRETLHCSLAAERRHELHRRVALALERSRGRWPQVAHHYLEAGPAARADAVRALRLAGAQARSELAFAEAAGFYQRALDELAAEPSGNDRERCELLLGLASARHAAGEPAAARRACRRAIELARALDEPELFACAALEYGAVLDVGSVDAELIELLEEALERLEPGDSAARARLMARLGGARQPADPPERQFELARRAIAMARRVGDPSALSDALRDGIAALMDLADPSERLALNSEHAELAERLGAPLDVLRAQGRIVFDAAELGEPGTVHAAIEACARIVDALDLEQHRWRVGSYRAMCAIFEGRFAEASTLQETAERQAAQCGEPWSLRSLGLQRLLQARLQGRWQAALAELDALEPELRRFAFGRSVSSLLRASVLSESGQTEQAAALWSDELADWPLVLGDLSLLEICTEAVLASRARAVQERVLERLRREAHRFVSWGALGATIGPPAGAMVGRLLVALGEVREGEQRLREALARARAVGGLPHAARLSLHLAHLPGARDAKERARDALQLARSLDMPGLAEAARDLLDGPAAASPLPTVAYFQMRREGDVWVFDCDGDSFVLKDLKGLHLLSRLVEAEGRELHVLDLESPTGAAPPEAGGDAGEAIDEPARDAYRRRAAELSAELEEAESWNDAGRAERARAELAALESELSRALGLGGRPRREASQVERARINVQRRLRDAIRRIESQHGTLGKHLSWAVRTGVYCSYQPR